MSPTRRQFLTGLAGAATALAMPAPSQAAKPPALRLSATMRGSRFVGDHIEERSAWLEFRIAGDHVSINARIGRGPQVERIQTTDPGVIAFMGDVARLFDRHAVGCVICRDTGAYRGAYTGELFPCPVCGPLRDPAKRGQP